MWSWFTFWLFLHILAAVVAFGPTFAFGLIGAQVGKEPMHAAFGVHIMDLIERRMTIPFALSLPVSGTGLILTAHVDLWQSEWLLISIGVYLFALTFATTVQTRNSARLVTILRSMPPGPPPEGASGPPPEVAALTKKLQMGGAILTVAVLVILLLMIWRPGAAFS
jgi:uncharacterized membrane protein